MRTKLRSKVTLLFIVCAVLIAVPGAAALAQDTGTSPAPTIQSDKADYAPGELVTLTGSGWQPGESVHINVDDDQTKTWSRNVDVTADASGNITDSFNLPDWFVATYKVTATGAQSGTVTTSFTDANPQDLLVSPASVTVTQGSNATYSATVQMGGNNDPCTTTLSASGLPSGASAAFTGNPNPRTGNSNYTSTLTVSTTGATPTGSHTFTVTMTRGSNCQGQGNISKQLTLVVNAPTPTDTTPPAITHTLNPANPDGANQWYKSNVSLTWSVTDPESAVTKTGCVNQNITSDQQATNYTCSATSAGGSSGPVTVSIKRDATPPTNIQFVGGPAANGSYAFGSVPAEPTCTATDATSTMDTCVVAGYSNAVGNQTLISTATDKAGNQATQTRTYTVTKANQTINFGTLDNKTFGDADFNASATGGGSGNPVTFAATGDCTVSGNTVHITGAGSCTITASQAGNDNYNAAAPVPQTFTIEKANATIDVQGYTGTYDGTAHGATGNAKGVNDENLNSLLDLGASFTNVPGGTANWSFAGNTNYKSANGSVDIVINKADATIDVQGYTGTYDAQAHGATGTATGVGGTNLSSLLDLGAKFTDVPGGTANWTFAGNGNYNDASGSVEIKIDKADTTTTVTCDPGPFTYTGAPHTPCQAKVTGPGGLDQPVPVDYTNNVDAGPVTASASYAGSDNYKPSQHSETFTILKADATIDVQGYTGTYDGNAHGATGTAKGVNDENLSNLLHLGDSFTNVPGGTANWTFAGNGNYNDASGSVEIKIDKADATIDVQGYTGVYDGNAHGASGSAKGVNNEDLSSLLDFGDKFTDVPGGTANWTFSGNTNYKAANGTAQIVINKADATIDVQGYTGVYDGQEHGANGSAKGVNNEDLSSLLDFGDKFTDVPGGTANWTFAGNGNYNEDSGSVEIKIDKADATTAVTCPASVTYNGLPHTPCSAKVTGPGGLDQSLTVNYQDNTNAGTAKASASYAGTGNYNASQDSETFSIQKANQTITFAALSDKIVGAADFNVSATANSGLPVSFAASPNATCTISGNSVHIAGVGTCTITASQAGNDNYNAAPNVSQTFKVTYNFGGFLQPINYTAHQVLDSNVSTFKGGSTVPVKFQLKDATGKVVQSASAPQWLTPQKGSATSQPVDETLFTDPATSGTLYKWDGTQYHYNWSTKGVTAGFYYKIGVKLDDGQTYYTYISLR